MNQTISLNRTTFLSGPAGAGKTTLAVQHLRALLEGGTRGDSILVMSPQRSLLRPYLDELHRADLPPGSLVETLTLGGLARRMTDLFWPAVAKGCGFARPQDPPVFLTLETAQHYMARVAGPLVAEAGYFEGVHIQPNRLYSQILDNLNKAAVVGFSHLEVGRQLKEAWNGPAARANVFSQAQDCATRFRQFCLENNLLDFSLQVEVLTRHLLKAIWFQSYLFRRYRHLIVDNIEEDTPVTHDLLRDWLAKCDSALIVYDEEAGFRRFLGADPDGGLRLREVCQDYVRLSESHVISPELEALAGEMARSLSRHVGRGTGSLSHERQLSGLSPRPTSPRGIREALGYGGGRFHPQMLDWVAAEITCLVKGESATATAVLRKALTTNHNGGIRPGEIVVLSPYLSDALRFALSERLARAGVPVQSLRPSRALNEEPAARCLLTLAALAYPEWNLSPARPDVAHTLAMTVDGLDPARAHLVAQRAYAPSVNPERDPSALPLRSFDGLVAELQDRIGFEVGERYERLRVWLCDQVAQAPLPLDHFLSRLFGEVLSQPGFAFHRDLDSGRVTAGLIASARKFRQVVAPVPAGVPNLFGPTLEHSQRPEGQGQYDFSAIGRAYFDMVQSGIIAAEYGRTPGEEEANAVLLTPAYTFLLSNKAVDVQFWINAGSPGWWERLNQPLTHPYVLTRWWPAGRQWTDEDEQAARVTTLHRLIQGLIRRCRCRVYLAFSTLNEQGFEERGPLLMLAQQILRHLPAEE